MLLERERGREGRERERKGQQANVYTRDPLNEHRERQNVKSRKMKI